MGMNRPVRCCHVKMACCRRVYVMSSVYVNTGGWYDVIVYTEKCMHRQSLKGYKNT